MLIRLRLVVENPQRENFVVGKGRSAVHGWDLGAWGPTRLLVNQERTPDEKTFT